MPKHRTFSPEFKTQLMLAVISGEQSAAEVCRAHRLKPDLFSKWKAHFLANAAAVFQREEADPAQARIAELERLAGRLSLELEVAKKASSLLRSPSTRNAE